MKLIKGLLLAAVAATGSGLEAATGSSEADAIELKPKTAVQKAQVELVQEGTNHVCYYKIVAAKGKAYTLWLSDFAPGSEIKIDEVYSQLFGEGFEMGPTAQFEAAQCGDTVRWVMSGKEWADESSWSGGGSGSGSDPWGGSWGDWGDWGDDSTKTPNTWPYYIRIIGAKGETATLNYQIGNAIPPGVEQNPLVIKPKTTTDQTTETLDFLGRYYYLQLDMKAGARYHFKTSGGSADNELTLESALGGLVRHLDTTPGNDYETIVPSASGTYKVWISSSRGLGATAKLTYRVDAERTIREHKVTATLAANQGVTCKPGHLNAWNTGAYDDIIDECLYKFTAEKGVDYLALTEGAAKDLLMRVYDSKGNVIASNAGDGVGQDVRCAIPAATKKTDYFIGVCENLGVDDDVLKPAYLPVNLTVRSVDLEDDLIPLTPVVGENTNRADVVRTKDPAGLVAPTPLGDSCWSHVYTIAGRKGVAYALASSWVADAGSQKLTAEVYTLSGKKEKLVTTGDLTPGSAAALVFPAMDNDVHYIRVKPAAGMGLAVPAYKVHAMGFAQSGALGSLKVVLKGADAAAWKLNSEKAEYVSGDSMLLPAGRYTVKFVKVSGFGTPENKTVDVVAGEVTEVETYYGDTFDPKDDTIAGATKWTLKNAETEKTALSRTLWKKDDPADCFEIAGKDGYLYDIHLKQDEKTDQDAVFRIEDAAGKVVYGPVTEVRQAELPAEKSKKYYLKVVHKDQANPGNTSYVLNGHFANVGAIKFSKASLSVKDNATSVKLTVNRTAKDGMVRVRYYTVDGNAKSNEQYIAQSDILEWADKDSKAKTVEIKLIPKLLSLKMDDTAFKVVLTDAGGDYPAPITVPECEITIQNSGRYDNAAAAYAAANKTKKATTTNEKVPLRAGTYYGVVQTQSTTNGLPELASVTLTVSAKDADDPSKDTLSAKVALAGKTYNLKPARGESAWDEGVPGGVFKKDLLLTQKIGTVTVSNVLSVSVHDGQAADWTKVEQEPVALKMNVPDVKGRGFQSGIAYSGTVFRQNAKIQGYLDAVTNFFGYYTVSLVPREMKLTSGLEPTEGSGLPSGNGYLTVTVDNKGGAKVAGLLADGTKVSASATACAIFADETSANGYTMHVPVFGAKSPYCFGGLIVLTARKDENRPDGKSYKVVVDLANSWFVWNNDNAALTYDGKEGWRMKLATVGGWYDKVVNLQAYYNDRAQQFSIDTIEAEGFPKEIFASGFSVVTEVQPNGEDVDLAGDKMGTAKKSLVKVSGRYDFTAEGTANPCNVQVKLARATGIVTGSCSVWSENGSAQKEITGFKHNGVITLDRDDGANEFLSNDVISAGFLNKSIKVIGNRNWAFSVPFGLTADSLED